MSKSICEWGIFLLRLAHIFSRFYRTRDRHDNLAHQNNKVNHRHSTRKCLSLCGLVQSQYNRQSCLMYNLVRTRIYGALRAAAMSRRPGVDLCSSVNMILPRGYRMLTIIGQNHVHTNKWPPSNFRFRHTSEAWTSISVNLKVESFSSEVEKWNRMSSIKSLTSIFLPDQKVNVIFQEVIGFHHDTVTNVFAELFTICVQN